MAKFNDIVYNFINGEVSPRMYGRTDTDVYRRSCKKLQNMHVVPQGGVRRRCGTEFILDTINDAEGFDAIGENSHLVDFVYSDSEKYTIIFTGTTMDASGLGFSATNYVYIYNNSNGKMSPVPYGTGTYNVSTNITTSNFRDINKLREMSVAQNGDLMFFAHKDLVPFVIQRTAQDSFTMNNFYDAVLGQRGTAITSVVPYQTQNTTAITLNFSAASGTGVTMTAGSSLFDPGMVGGFFAVQDSGSLGVAYVKSYTSATVMTVDIKQNIPAAAVGGNSSTQWYESSWSDYRGWPRTVAFWNSASVFGGSDSFPDTLWKSQDYDVFELSKESVLTLADSPVASDAFNASLAADKAAFINGLMVSNENLLVLTEEREYYVRTFSPTSIDIRSNSSKGSAYVDPISVDETVVFVKKGGRDVMRLVYDDRFQGYVAESIGFLSEHIFKYSMNQYTDSVAPKLVKIVHQERPSTRLWGIDINGYLYSSTISSQGGVLAWDRVELGGTTSEGLARVLSIASVPSREGTEDDIMLLVKRRINSSDVVFFEKLRPEFWESALNRDVSDKYRLPIFLDACKIFRTSGDLSFYAPMTSDGDAVYSLGTGTATETNTVAYSRGWASFDSSSYLTYDGTDNADVAQVGSIRFKWRRVTSGVSDYMVAISKSAASDDNLISIIWNSSNEIVVSVNDSAGSSIISNVVGTISLPVYGPEIHFALDYDFTAGDTKLFVNGEQFGSTMTGTGTRDTDIDNIKLGATYDGGSQTSAESSISEFAIYSAVQNTANHEVFEVQPNTTTIYGLDYLEGQTVKVLADGKSLGEKTVSSGTITIDATYSTVIVGLSYTHILEPVPPNFGGAIGSRDGQPTRYDRIIGRFNETAACNVGRDLDNLKGIIFRDSLEPLANPISLVTDDKEIYHDGEYGITPTVVLSGSDPLPCNVTALIFRGKTYE